MKALLLEEIGKIAVAEIPVPEPGPGETLIRVNSAALCRTDAKMWKMGHRDLVLPRVLGHEICATREDNGKRCVVWPGESCGECGICQSGYENLCQAMRISGFHRDGGLAEYMVAKESSLVEIEDDVPDEVACLAEPVACTMNALKMADVQKGQKVLILGAGPVGLMMALAVKSREAEPTVCEINPGKIRLSKEFQDKTGIKVAEELPEGGFHVAINAAPSLETFGTGIGKLLTGGCFCIFSGFTETNDDAAKEIVNLLNEIHYRQLRIASAYGCTKPQVRLAADLIRQRADDFSLLVENTVSLGEVPGLLPEIWEGKVLRYVVKFG